MDNSPWALSLESVILALTVVAEAVVAWAILSESETSRRFHFVEKTTRDQKNKDRAEIYSEFLKDGTVSDRNTRSEAFVKTLWNNSTLKRQCDSQIEMLNDLGLIIESGLSPRKDFYVRIFPHAAVYIWVILNPYIHQRRKDAGPLFARPMLLFMKECTTLLVGQGRDLHLRNKEGTIAMTLSWKDLKEIQIEIDNALTM